MIGKVKLKPRLRKQLENLPLRKLLLLGRKMANEIEKEIVKEAIKEWLNEKVTQFGWFSLRTLFYVFVAGLGYAYLTTHGWSLPK